MKRAESVLSFLLLLSSGVAQHGFVSIHELEAESHRSYAYLSETQWDSVNGLSPAPLHLPSARTGSVCTLNKQVMGYHPYWAGTAFNSYQWSLLSTVIFFSYEVDPSTGNYANPTVINTWRTTSLVPTAHNNGTEVQLCATLFGGTNLTNFLTNPSARLRCIDSLVSLVSQRSADGINIDFEGLPAAQRVNFVSFMQQLHDTLQRRLPNAKLSVALPAVDWNNAYDVITLSNLCDQLFIMGYDFYWSTAPTAGPTGLLHVGQLWGSRCNSRTLIDYLANGANRNKLILGVPYYGFRYPTTTNTYPSSTTGNGVARTYQNAYNEANTYGWNWDSHSRSRYFIYQSGGQWYQTWWHDSLSLAWIYRTVIQQGIGGVGMWALSYDGSRPELWGALRDHFTSCATVRCQDTLFDMGGTHGNYFNREDWTWTLSPTGAVQVTVTFHSFSLENGYDTLFIYDGPSTASPLIGSYTGTNSPGVVVGTNGSLTFRYKSDNATNAQGWLATWSCLMDADPPVTTIRPLRDWYGRSFLVEFDDADNNQVAERYVCVADYDGTVWSANGGKGFAYEDFSGGAISSDWTAFVGNWQVNGGVLVQTDVAANNTNLFFPVAQDANTEWLYHWKMQIGGTGSNRRGGLHIFVSDPTQTQRGDSYLLWFRLDQQRIEIYRITGNVLPSPQYQQNYPFAPNTWYDIKATYNPTTGLIRIWINDVLSASWRDPSPLTTGGHISLRTGNAEVAYDEIRVYRSRSSSFWVEVGVGGHARYESATPSTPAVRILSQIRDGANWWSNVAIAETKADLTPPSTSVVTTGWKTADYVQDFIDNDALSGIERHFFLPLFRAGNTWEASSSAGFLYDEFAATSGSWLAGVGSWQISSGVLQQQDVTSTNTGYHHAVLQGSIHLYRVQARLLNSTGNRRWGFHILADDISQSQRGNSYLIWLRYDQQDVQIYETISNILHTRWTIPYALSPYNDYLVEVLYDSGYIAVWINGNFVVSWKDDTPLMAGGYISLRTNQAEVEWEKVEVWRNRSGNSVLISVGTNGLLAAENSAPSQAGGRILSRVMDRAELFSAISQEDVNVDWTPPSSPPAVRDGTALDETVTSDGTQLTGNWDASADPNSDVMEYEYAIGTAPGLTDVVGWSPTGGSALSHTHSPLNLVHGQTYYFGVRAKNGAGLVGDPTWSDGILVDITSSTFSFRKSFRLYPSPAGEFLIVDIENIANFSDIILLDNSGRILAKFQVEGPTMSIPLSTYSKGVYWLWLPPYPPVSFIHE
ncbi:MAG: glycosyl hydrolase family 18 protein [Bacteroidia bacterium]|nr:glycosyl hydrolase family 18 protein [Bacteroidia bacterium]MDW8133893.1 glycosyl hydrolase family 18 protein [Bacteroidia bacterium]